MQGLGHFRPMPLLLVSIKAKPISIFEACKEFGEDRVNQGLGAAFIGLSLQLATHKALIGPPTPQCGLRQLIEIA